MLQNRQQVPALAGIYLVYKVQYMHSVDEFYTLQPWLEHLTANAKAKTALGSITASSDTVDSARR